MRRRLSGLALLAAALVAGCGDAAPASSTAAARPLSLTVGGSANMAGAVVSQPRTDAPGGRGDYAPPR